MRPSGGWTSCRERHARPRLAGRGPGPNEPGLVAFTLASNALGTVTPAAEIVRRARARRRAGGGGRRCTSRRTSRSTFAALGVDLLFTSPYKYFGPHLGRGVRPARAARTWPPYRVRPPPDGLPDRWEPERSATRPWPDWSRPSTTSAVWAEFGDDGLRDRGGGGDSARSRAYEGALTRRFLAGLAGIPGLTVYGIADPGRVERADPNVRGADRRHDAPRRGGGAGPARGLRLGRELLRAVDHGTARPGGVGGRRPDRVLPLQHGRTRSTACVAELADVARDRADCLARRTPGE